MKKILVVCLFLFGCASSAVPSPEPVSKKDWEEANARITAAIMGIAEYISAVQERGMLPMIEAPKNKETEKGKK